MNDSDIPTDDPNYPPRLVLREALRPGSLTPDENAAVASWRAQGEAMSAATRPWRNLRFLTAKALRDQGATFREIGERIGRHGTTARTWVAVAYALWPDVDPCDDAQMLAVLRRNLADEVPTPWRDFNFQDPWVQEGNRRRLKAEAVRPRRSS